MQKNQSPETLLSLAAKISTSLKAMHDRTLGDLTSSQFRVLEALVAAPLPESVSGLSHQWIGKETSIHRSTLSEMLPRMRAAGLITMWTNPDDERSRLVSITPEGRDRYRRAARAITAAEKRIEMQIPRLRRTIEALAEIT